MTGTISNDDTSHSTTIKPVNLIKLIFCKILKILLSSENYVCTKYAKKNMRIISRENNFLENLRVCITVWPYFELQSSLS
jgi:hypothetical protein